jgi:hypothetical protein
MTMKPPLAADALFQCDYVKVAVAVGGYGDDIDRAVVERAAVVGLAHLVRNLPRDRPLPNRDAPFHWVRWLLSQL